MTLIRRDLTVNFDRAITTTSQTPEVMEVVLVPLSDPSSNNSDVTLVGGLQKQTVVLSHEVNPVVFQIVPTDEPGLTDRITYRIAWRKGIIGRTFTYDFAMPDADITFDDLFDLDSIIGGEVYLQQSDLGVPGRVATLDSEGRVIDANGNLVATQDDIVTEQHNLSVEIVQRQQGDRDLLNSLEDDLIAQSNAMLSTSRAYTDSRATSLTNSLASETASRQTGDTTLNTRIDSVAHDLDIANTTIGQHTTTFTQKADLDGTGHVPLGQIPASAITNAVPVADQAAMLALTQVQPGDIAVRPDSAWILIGSDPSQLSNWHGITRVSSVNGQQGAVVLTAADVGAVATDNGMVDIDQVTGLQTALDAKAATTVTSGLNTRVTTIEGDTTTVHTSGGFISHLLNDSHMAYINDSSQITKKDGTVLSLGGGSAVSSVNGHTGDVVLSASDVGALATGGSIGTSQVTGLATALSAKVDTTDGRLTDARTPTAHAATHGSGQTDEVTVATDQVTGLDTTLTDHGSRLSTLETEIEGLGGGPTGYPAKADWFHGADTFTGVTSLTDFKDTHGISVRGPFGFNSTDHYYYNPAGATDGEQQYAYITPGGHLAIVEWDESNPPDPTYALDSSLSTLTTTVGTKASQSELDTLTTTVSGKASQSALDTLTTTVGTKASQSALDTLTTTVGTKADASSLTTTQTTVSGILTTLTSKADLDGTSHIPLAQLPTAIPGSRITGFSSKADLDGSSKVLLTQIPSGITTDRISGLDAALTAKADLVGGLLSLSQVPPIAKRETYVVSNRAAMLALTTSQVQVGDCAIINATADQGTYTLNASDPTQFANWVFNIDAPPPVSSVNGRTGTVVLAWTDVGAMAANAVLPFSQVNNLQTTLDSKATTTALTTGLAGKTSTTDVQGILSGATEIKQVVNYVATSAVASLSGQQSADGVLMALGSIVLLTAQSSSVNNGLWIVNSGAWTRAADFTTGSYLVKGTLVLVSAGNTNANTIWQCTSASGVVDTNASSWTKAMSAGPPLVYTQGNGISISGQVVTAIAATGAGCQVTSTGIGVDPAVVPRMFKGAVPSGSTLTTITHNLNTTSVDVTLIEVSSGDIRGVGKTITGVNTVQLEFQTPPTSGQYRVLIVG